MDITPLAQGDIGKVKELLSLYGFGDYRAYRILNKDKLREYLFDRVRSCVKDKNSRTVTAGYKNKITGLATLDLLPWDTRIFGVKMARISNLMAGASSGEEAAVKEGLLDYLLGLCEKEKIIHLSCRVDTADSSGVRALEKKGFMLMDTLVTYVFNRHKHSVPRIKEIYKIRDFKKGDLPALIAISRNAFSLDRFHHDPYLAGKKADRIFEEWIKDSCRDLKKNRVFVAEKAGRAAAFLTFRLNTELERFTGYKIAGHGLSAVSAEAKGAYPLLIRSALQDIVLHRDFLEFDTQLNNREPIMIWQRFGFDFIRSKYTFHKCLKATA